MRVLFSLCATVAHAAISSTQPQLFDAEHMRETFKAIAAQQVAQGGEISQATKDNIEAILTLIRGNITAALAEDYRLVLEQYKGAEAALKACNKNAGTCDTTLNSDKRKSYFTALAAHQHCRAFEHRVCSYKETDCGIVNTRVQGLTPPSWRATTAADDACDDDGNGRVKTYMDDALAFVRAQGPGCNDGETPAACFARTSSGPLGQKGCDTAARNANCEERLNGTHCPGCDYASQRANCLAAIALENTQRGQCRSKQQAMEISHCQYLGQGCSCCSSFFQCWASQSKALDAERAATKKTIDLIHAQQEALECLDCYGRAILTAGTTDFQECDRQGCKDCHNMPYPCSDISPDYKATEGCRKAFWAEDPDATFSFPFTEENAVCNNSPVATLGTECTGCKDALAGAVAYKTECVNHMLPNADGTLNTATKDDVSGGAAVGDDEGEAKAPEEGGGKPEKPAGAPAE